jgi:hypothetical protein
MRLKGYYCCGMRIRDVNPGPGFFHPEYEVNRASVPGPRIHNKNLCIFNPRKCYETLGNKIRGIYRGPGFFPIRIPDTGVKEALDPGSAIFRLTQDVLFYSITVHPFLPLPFASLNKGHIVHVITELLCRGVQKPNVEDLELQLRSTGIFFVSILQVVCDFLVQFLMQFCIMTKTRWT